MPKKINKNEKNYYPTDIKSNRIRPVLDDLIGIEDPEDLMIEILDILKITERIPRAGNFYVFVYKAKTPNMRYDENPLVAVTGVFSWGFRGINFHWGTVRQYTWNEVIGPVHFVTREELKDLQTLPFAKFRINN
jgi:hypothetical protein